MSATWYGVPVTVKIDLDSGPWVASASLSWSDISDDARSISCNRGRSSELSTYSPGSVTVVLDNRSRTYDLANTASAHYGKKVQRKRLQILFGGTAVFTGFIASWLLEWPEFGKDATVTVTATDALDVLAGASLPSSAYSAAVLADSPINYWQMQDDLSADLLVDVVDPTGDMVRYASSPQALDTLPCPIGATTAQLGNFQNPRTTSLTTPATLEMWASTTVDDNVQMGEVMRAASSTDFFSVKVGTFTAADAGGGPRALVEARYSHGGKRDSAGSGVTITFPVPAGDAFHLAVTASSTTLTVYVNGTAVGTDTLAAGSWTYGTAWRARIYTSETKALSHVAAYSSTLTANQIAAHYLAGTHPFGHPYGERGGARIGRILDAIGWPAGDRNLSTGETVLGNWLPASGDALSACRAVEVADQGMFFAAADGDLTFLSRQDTWTTTRNITAQATFGEGVGEIPTKQPFALDAESLDYTRNVVSVSYAGGSVTSKNETSTTAYGELPDSVNAQLIPSSGGWLARQLAAFRLRLRAVPTSRVPTLTVETFEDDGTASTYMTTLKALELGDRVRVIRRPNGTTDPIDLQLTLQGIRWRFSPNAGFSWQAYVSPAVPSYTEAPYLTVGDATYGKIGVSDGNLVPF